MAMEIYILSARAMVSIDEWQRSIDDSGFPLRLSTGVPFAKVRGFVPATLEGENTGFECNHWRVSDVLEAYQADIPAQWVHALALRMTGRTSEVVSAYMAASAYARGTGGAVFDCEEGKVISAQRAAEIAREIEIMAPRIEESARKAVQAAMQDWRMKKT